MELNHMHDRNKKTEMRLQQMEQRLQTMQRSFDSQVEALQTSHKSQLDSIHEHYQHLKEVDDRHNQQTIMEHEDTIRKMQANISEMTDMLQKRLTLEEGHNAAVGPSGIKHGTSAHDTYERGHPSVY